MGADGAEREERSGSPAPGGRTPQQSNNRGEKTEREARREASGARGCRGPTWRSGRLLAAHGGGAAGRGPAGGAGGAAGRGSGAGGRRRGGRAMERRDGPAERHRARSPTAAAQTESGPARARQSLRQKKAAAAAGGGGGRKIKGENKRGRARGEGGKRAKKTRRRGHETRIVLRKPRPPLGAGAELLPATPLAVRHAAQPWVNRRLFPGPPTAAFCSQSPPVSAVSRPPAARPALRERSAPPPAEPPGR